MKKITLLFCLLVMSFANAQVTSVAMVGSGTPWGWPTNTAGEVDGGQMTLSGADNWSISSVALNGNVKFRGNNSWSPYDWGTLTFPTGTAVSGNSAAYFVPAGLYDVTFNSTTLAYTFTLLTDVYPVVSLVGTAVSNDPLVFEVDADMTTTDGIVYNATNVHLYPGAVKWRENHAWANNWGPQNTNDLVGTAIFNSQDAVTIVNEGYYNASFNKSTLAYSFTFPSIAIVGNATPANWPTNEPGEIDSQVLSTTDGVNYTMSGLPMAVMFEGETAGFKFRQDNSWGVQWGASTAPGFPSGIGTQTGDDIHVDVDGIYNISFNRLTGEYMFTTLGLNEFQQTIVKAYPNPTRNSWNFTSAGEAISNIRVTDFSGKVILEMTPNANDAVIDASNLSTGMYFANVSSASGSKTIKVVKQ